MVPLAATANDGVLAASGVGSVTSVEIVALVATSMAVTVSLVPATSSTVPSGVRATLLAGRRGGDAAGDGAGAVAGV